MNAGLRAFVLFLFFLYSTVIIAANSILCFSIVHWKSVYNNHCILIKTAVAEEAFCCNLLWQEISFRWKIVYVLTYDCIRHALWKALINNELVIIVQVFGADLFHALH